MFCVSTPQKTLHNLKKNLLFEGINGEKKRFEFSEDYCTLIKAKAHVSTFLQLKIFYAVSAWSRSGRASKNSVFLLTLHTTGEESAVLAGGKPKNADPGPHQMCFALQFIAWGSEGQLLCLQLSNRHAPIYSFFLTLNPCAVWSMQTIFGWEALLSKVSGEMLRNESAQDALD